MVKVISPIKCGKCGEVTIFEINAPTEGSKQFQFLCPNGHEASSSTGGYEVVDLKKYDQGKLKRVAL